MPKHAGKQTFAKARMKAKNPTQKQKSPVFGPEANGRKIEAIGGTKPENSPGSKATQGGSSTLKDPWPSPGRDPAGKKGTPKARPGDKGKN